MDRKEGKGKIRSYGMYITALLIFGTNGLYVSRISLSASQIVLMRTLIGAFLLTVLVLLRGGFNKKHINEEKMPLLVGGAALGLNWIMLFEAYKMLNISLATLIYYMGPILVLLVSPVVFREKLTGKKIMSILIVIIGMISISGSIVFAKMNPMGLGFAIASAILYAVLIIFNKKIIHTSGLQTAAIELNVAFVVGLIYVQSSIGMPNITERDLPFIAIIGFVNTGLAYLLYFSGLQNLTGQSVALISYLDPVFALLFSAIFLHEVMTPIQLIGAVLIIGGAMLGELK